MLIKFRQKFYSNLVLVGIGFVCFVCYFKLHESLKDVNHSINKLKTSLISKAFKYSEIQYFEKLIQADATKQVPGLGDNGESVSLEGEAKLIGEKNLEKFALNVELSEHLSYNRTTRDIRNPLCRNIKYDRDSLPKASVVIIFHNEPYSVLLRTIHSVLRTTDRRNLKEIILVDDASTNDELIEKLDYYVLTRLPQDVVKIVRLKHRSGLIRARLAGAQVATAEVLVFLDAHCEGVVDWLEPLLARIQESPTSVVVPIVDIIDKKDFKYRPVPQDHTSFMVGGFTWNGKYNWIYILKQELARKQNECPKEVDICPTYTPTMPGGLFAISRDYFWMSGSYDEQMHGWGGEHLEMSFRIWQCGGTIETIPCSRFGHIFRNFRPYSLPDGRDTEGINLARMALVWMDEYIDILYLYLPGLKNYTQIGDVTDRLNLRQKLKCKSFDWYLKNVFPEKFIPTKNVIGYGRFAANSTNLCIDNLQRESSGSSELGLYTCIRTSIARTQFYSLTNSGILRTEMSCALVKTDQSPPYRVVMAPCHNGSRQCHQWIYSDLQIRHLNTDMCLDHEGLTINDSIVVKDCDPNKISQKWIIEH